MKRLFLISTLLLSCTLSDKNTSSKPEVKRKWLKSLVPDDYLGPRLPSLMEPMILDDQIILASGIGYIYSLRLSSRVLWKFKAEGGVHGIIMVEGKIFFATSAGVLYSLDKDGNLLWKLRLDHGVTSKPVYDSGKLFLLANEDKVYSIDLNSKTIDWIYSRNTFSDMNVFGTSTPVSFKGNLLVGFSDGTLVFLDRKTAKPIWEKELAVDSRFKDLDSMLLEYETLYVSSFDGDLYALEADTGKELWKKEGLGGFANPVVEEDVLVALTSKDEIVALNKKTSSVLWSYRLDSASSPISLYNKVIYFVTKQGGLIGLDLSTGEVLFSYTKVSGSSNAPKIMKDTIYILSDAGVMFALRIKGLR